MKKLALTGFALLMMSNFFMPTSTAKVAENVDYGCIITTCFGTICSEKFKDHELAVKMLNDLEDECDRINENA